jgi:glycosyltransferase involved in cell wall biosynthesis
VLLPVHIGTCHNYFSQALKSILNQTHPANEYVIIFDGPVCEKVKVVISNQFTDEHIKKLKTVGYSKNMGLGYALNEGVKVCECDYIVRMDDDDICMPDRLERHLKAINEQPLVDVFGGQIIEFYDDQPPQMRKVPETHADIKRQISKRNMMNHVTICFRRIAVLSAGNYDPTIRAGFEDYELWHRMLAAGCLFSNLADPLVLVRFNNTQLSRRSGISYLSEEWKMHMFFLRKGYISVWNFTVTMIIRSVSRLLPSYLLRLVYGRLLRRSLPPEKEKLCLTILREIGQERSKS